MILNLILIIKFLIFKSKVELIDLVFYSSSQTNLVEMAIIVHTGLILLLTPLYLTLWIMLIKLQ